MCVSQSVRNLCKLYFSERADGINLRFSIRVRVGFDLTRIMSRYSHTSALVFSYFNSVSDTIEGHLYNPRGVGYKIKIKHILIKLVYP